MCDLPNSVFIARAVPTPIHYSSVAKHDDTVIFLDPRFCVLGVTWPKKTTHYSPLRKRSASTDPFSTQVFALLVSLGAHGRALCTVVFGTVLS